MAKKRSWLTAWIPRRLELYLSPAWRHAPRPVKNMLERLEVENLRHGNFRNGELYVSYGQFVEAGISRRIIRPTYQLGQALGLLEVTQETEGGRGDLREPNTYRVTYLATGNHADKPPTDEWKTVTEERAKVLVA